MKREEAIILSMTRMERQNHRIIGPSRRARIARGSGTSVFEVNRFLKKFEKTCLMMKKMIRRARSTRPRCCRNSAPGSPARTREGERQ